MWNLLRKALFVNIPLLQQIYSCMFFIGLKLSTTKFKRHKDLPWETDPPHPTAIQLPAIGLGASEKILMPRGLMDWVSLQSLASKAGAQGLPTHMWSPFREALYTVRPWEGGG